jgi:hypothetical protein
MKKAFFVLACIGLLCWCASAQTWSNTLYNQEGTTADGYPSIDASGQGPHGSGTDPMNNYTNWKYQYGSGSWAGVYSWDTDAWLIIYDEGDGSMEIEVDIEMYCAETIENNKIYVHLGDPFNATADDRRAYMDGTLNCNNGQWVGISFEGTGKTEADFEKDGGGNFTGRIFDAMVGSVDAGGRDISSEAFDIVILMSWGAGYRVPDAYGDGSHGTQHDVLWWLVDGGNPGFYNLSWRITIEPDTHQPDGNYGLDPFIVSSPVI